MSTEAVGTEIQKDLVVVKPKPSPIAAWADRGDVRELAERLQMMMPGAQKLTQPESLALAQAAVAHGLDPFNGELWFLKDRQGKPLGLMAGIKGHRRAAHRQMEQEGGGNYWPEFEELDIDEKGRLGIPTDALAYRCKLRDTRTINHYTEQIERLLKAQLPWEAVKDIVGSRPYTEGVGFGQKSEKSRMTLVQRAMKRAEADALKRRFDLPFASIIGTGRGDEGDVYEGEFYTEEPQLSQETAEKAQADLDANRDLLRGTEKERDWDGGTFDAAEESEKPKSTNGSRPLSPGKLKLFLISKAEGKPETHQTAVATPGQQGLVAGKLAECFAPADDADQKRHSVLLWLWGNDSTKDLTMAAAGATLDWLLDKDADEGTYDLHSAASQEAQAVLKVALKEAGQQELEL